MPVTGPLVTRRKEILVALETDRGTPEAAPAIVVQCYDPMIQCRAEYIESRPAGGSSGSGSGWAGALIGQFSARVALRGNGEAQAPDLDPGLAALLLACGFQAVAPTAGPPATPTIYKPQSVAADQQTATIWVYEDGLWKGLAGAAGTVTIEAQTGRPTFLNFEMQGAWQPPEAAEFVPGTHSAVRAPTLIGATLSLGESTPRFSRISIRMGNVVDPRHDATAPGGVLHFCVPSRDVQITMDPEATADDDDAFAAWLAGSTAALSLKLGTEAGNTFTIEVPALQYRAINEGDRGGKLTHEIEAQAVDADGDEGDLTITMELAEPPPPP